MVLRNCLGMIMSVSTFWMSSLAAMPLSWVNLGRPALPPLPPPLLEAAESTESARLTGSSTGAAPGQATGSGSGSRGSRSRISASLPVTAAAAAMAGLTRWVLPPLPWRPSKFLLEVLAQRSLGFSLSGFMARHMLHPGSLQSKPASLRTLSMPSNSACALTSPEPGTTIAYTSSATLRPDATAATARRSSMRPFVQLPMKTLSMAMSFMFSPPSSPMYSKARSTAARRCGSAMSFGAGTFPSMDATSCGEVPQVAVGAMSLASMVTTRS
mmetsp:Transcript_23689/g.69335  ORF Transcript_23689/g.69335 Transcript_23689/m.69335 type:complete len:270 (+) Transcript_23689:685-1494(+)